MAGDFIDYFQEKAGEAAKDAQQSNALQDAVSQLKDRKLNVLLVGAAGCGKSTTINALFRADCAVVGYGPDPMTAHTTQYSLSDGFTLWDSPGFGDNPSRDNQYAKEIAALLKRKGDDGNLLIDAVVVILDAMSRDLSSTYEMLENVIIPYMPDSRRIIVALNKCDAAMSGRNWNVQERQPEPRLLDYMQKKVLSVKERITGSTGIDCTPIFYSAWYRYNLTALLFNIVHGIPEEKRWMLADSVKRDPDMWSVTDRLQNYGQDIQQEMSFSMEKALRTAAVGAASGASIGSLIPVVGPAVGAAVGAFLGFIGGGMNGGSS